MCNFLYIIDIILSSSKILQQRKREIHFNLWLMSINSHPAPASYQVNPGQHLFEQEYVSKNSLCTYGALIPGPIKYKANLLSFQKQSLVTCILISRDIVRRERITRVYYPLSQKPFVIFTLIVKVILQYGISCLTSPLAGHNILIYP